MILSWDAAAWEDFQYWLDTDKAMTRKVRGLLKECPRTPRARASPSLSNIILPAFSRTAAAGSTG